MFRIIQTLLNQRNLVGLQDRKRFPCGWFCGDDHIETLSDGISRVVYDCRDAVCRSVNLSSVGTKQVRLQRLIFCE